TVQTMDLDPGIRTYIDEANAVYGDDGEHAPVEAQRAAYTALCRHFARPYPASVSASDRLLEIRQQKIPVRIYRPAGDLPLPGVVFFHGGGWVLGGLDSHDSITADLCGRTGAVVVAVDYRLAPEHPFPAAFDDSYDAVAHIAAQSAEFGIEATHLAVCGDSAGGNLAAAVALAARDRGGPPIAGQALIYPACGNDFDLPSCHENAEAPMLTRSGMIEYWDMYMGGDPSRADRYAAPLRAGDFRGLPPAFITTAQHDPVRDDGRLYGERLRDAGVRVEYRNAARLVHGWLRARHISPDAMLEFEALCAALGRMLRAKALP
ncbi:MAG: alpha/beta hydrolase, partial [Dongiaceae bacterium]